MAIMGVLHCADPIVKAVQSAKRGIPIIPRVGSNARLEDCGGSAGQLVVGFVIKGIILGVVACTLAKYDELPIQLRDFLYSEYPHSLKCAHNSSACAPFIALKCIMANLLPHWHALLYMMPGHDISAAVPVSQGAAGTKQIVGHPACNFGS